MPTGYRTDFRIRKSEIRQNPNPAKFKSGYKDRSLKSQEQNDFDFKIFRILVSMLLNLRILIWIHKQEPYGWLKTPLDTRLLNLPQFHTTIAEFIYS